MASVAENLRATLLSLKQISDRVKSLILTSVTKSELSTAKQEVIDAIDEIDIDTSDLAKQGSNQSATNTAILTAIGNIDIDTSDLAKQTQVKDGNDTAISVGKEIRSEVGTGSDTAAESGTLFAVVKWLKNKVNAITGYALQGSDATATNTAIAAKIGTPASGQPTELFAAIAAVGSGGATPQEIANAVLSAVSVNVDYSGITMQLGYECRSVIEGVLNNAHIISIEDNYIENIPSSAFNNYTSLVTLKLNNVSYINVSSSISNVPNLEYLYLPGLLQITTNYAISNNQNLKYLYAPKMIGTPGTGYNFSGNKLIDIVTGAYFNSNVSFVFWSPTEALRSDINTLVEEGEPFANNLEKLLYNIREHIAANLPNANYTFTFSAAVKAAIQADTATANAFTNKNWTIA